jgi:hypothetical protein
MHRKFRVRLGAATILLLVTSSLIQSPRAVMASPSITAELCQCVKYVTNRLFGLGMTVGAPNARVAQDLANQAYWDAAYKKFKSAGHYALSPDKSARKDDVIIMKGSTSIWVYNFKIPGWVKFAYIGGGAGHIGIVDTARYRDKYPINDRQLSGWQITMRSANWDSDYRTDANGWIWSDITNGSPYSITGDFAASDHGCSNVSSSWIFVPNGSLVSFWRPQR